MQPSKPRKILLVNHFNIETVCGTTVMFSELLRLAERCAPEVEFAYESYEAYPSTLEWRKRLDAAHADATCIVAVNAHIEVSWDLSEELFAWCHDRGIPAYVYAHDYWPQHKEALTALTGMRAGIVASTPFIAEQLQGEGFESEVIRVGVPLPDVWPEIRALGSSKVIASAGRLVPRKRLPDIVRAFGASGLDGLARLYLRVLPSNVFSAESDREQLEQIQSEIDAARLRSVEVDRQAGERPDYSSYSAYVCSSSYEGFSMTVIEAAFHGCPPLMSDIAPHQNTARTLFAERAPDFLYPVGDHCALAELLRDEILTGRRKKFLEDSIVSIRNTIDQRWSLQETARALSGLGLRAPAILTRAAH